MVTGFQVNDRLLTSLYYYLLSSIARTHTNHHCIDKDWLGSCNHGCSDGSWKYKLCVQRTTWTNREFKDCPLHSSRRCLHYCYNPSFAIYLSYSIWPDKVIHSMALYRITSFASQVKHGVTSFLRLPGAFEYQHGFYSALNGAFHSGLPSCIRLLKFTS